MVAFFYFPHMIEKLKCMTALELLINKIIIELKVCLNFVLTIVLKPKTAMFMPSF